MPNPNTRCFAHALLRSARRARLGPWRQHGDATTMCQRCAATRRTARQPEASSRGPSTREPFVQRISASQHAQRAGSACHRTGATARSTVEKSTSGEHGQDKTNGLTANCKHAPEHAPETPRRRRARKVSPLPRTLTRTAARLSGGRVACAREQPAVALAR